eukprot:TRINITY_DN22632_c0_g1_i1.p1 TRINITY_DN22632_c0_g1~~TRINITY_DN22632_c0_g1_i1.p1  ORF type:complete len:782 (-),score=117.86 TRINITY_DN22632_c0_g1_i1:49-2349(-)
MDIAGALKALLKRDAEVPDRLDISEFSTVKLSDEASTASRAFFSVFAERCTRDSADPWAVLKLMEADSNDELQNVMSKVQKVLSEAEHIFWLKLRSLAMCHAVQRKSKDPELEKYAEAEADADDELNKFNLRDIAEIRAFRCPPVGCREVIETWAILLSDDKYVDDGRTSWRQFLANRELMQDCQKFRAIDLSETTVRKVRDLMAHDWFDFEFQRRRSRATSLAVAWIQKQIRLYDLREEPAIKSFIELKNEQRQLAASIEVLEAQKEMAAVGHLETDSVRWSADVQKLASDAVEILSVARSCPHDFKGQPSFQRRALLQAMPREVAVELQWLTGERQEFRFGMDTKVQDAKDSIAEQISVPAMCQKWVHNERVMSNMSVFVDFFEQVEEGPRLEIMFFVEVDACYDKLLSWQVLSRDRDARVTAAKGLVQMGRDDLERSIGALLLEDCRPGKDRNLIQKVRDKPDSCLASLKEMVTFRSVSTQSEPYQLAMVNVIEFLGQRSAENEVVAAELIDGYIHLRTDDVNVVKRILEARGRLGDGQVLHLVVSKLSGCSSHELLLVVIGVLEAVVAGQSTPDIQLGKGQLLEPVHVDRAIAALKHNLNAWSKDKWSMVADFLLRSALIDKNSFMDICVDCAAKHFLPAIARLHDCLLDGDSTAFKKLVGIVCAPLSKDADTEARFQLVQVLAGISLSCLDDIVNFLCTCLLHHRSAEVRFAALKSISALPKEIRQHEEVESCLKLLTSTDWPHIRSYAKELIELKCEHGA